MARRTKTFELLDFPKFAVPSVLQMEAAQTAISLVERLASPGGFMSYGPIWSRMQDIVEGYANDAFILSEFNSYADDWKNATVQEAVRLLRSQFGGRGRWYPWPTKPIRVLGFSFKPSIKGIWHVDGISYAVMINARKGQHLTLDDRKFLARGIYELHCVDDPADPVPLIVDLSEPNIGLGRRLREYKVSPEEMISLDEFDRVVREFVKALGIAGVAVPSEADVPNIVSLFKKK